MLRRMRDIQTALNGVQRGKIIGRDADMLDVAVKLRHLTGQRPFVGKPAGKEFFR